MKVNIRKIKYKLNLDDGTVEKRWAHIPDQLMLDYFDHIELGSGSCTPEYPDDENDPEYDKKIENIRYVIIDIIEEHAAMHFNGKVQPVLDQTDCWEWGCLVAIMDYRLYISN